MEINIEEFANNLINTIVDDLHDHVVMQKRGEHCSPLSFNALHPLTKPLHLTNSTHVHPSSILTEKQLLIVNLLFLMLF
jgi:hypothetical protein